MRINRSAWQKRSAEDWQRILVFTDRTKLKAMGAYACSKASRRPDKNAGSVFEQRNTLARLRAHLRDEVRNRPRLACQGWRLLRLLRLCVRRMPPEPVRDLNSPAEGSFLEPFFISTQLQAALLAGQRALSGYSSSFSVISLNLFFFWRYLQ